jgi:outer membrane lipoprotein-sorting protein
MRGTVIASAAAPGGDELDETMRELHPKLEPSDELRRRIEGMAIQADTKNRRRLVRQKRFRIIGQTAAALATVTAAFVIVPKVAVAVSLNRMAAAMESVRSVRMTAYSTEPGQVQSTRRETIYQGGKWRIEEPTGYQIWTGGVLYSYDAREKRTTFRKKGEGPFAYNSSGFTMSAGLRDMARWGWIQRMTISDLGRTTLNGNPVRQVAIQQMPERGRMLFTIDTATDLPILVEHQDQQGGEWKTVERSELRYNETLSADLFTPKFPAGTPVVDEAAEENVWRKRLATPIAEARAGHRRIHLRDLSVTPEGDVFVLYTDGANAERNETGVSVFLKDDRGTNYLQSWQFQPYVWSPVERMRTGFVLNGERLQGAWFIPVTPETGRWQPRRFTLIFGDGKTAVIERTVTATTKGDLPEHIRYTARWASPESEARRSRLATRRQFYYMQREWEEVLRLTDEEMALNDAYRRESGQHLLTPDLYLARYKAFRALGREQEANEAKERLKAEDYYGNYKQEIEEIEGRRARP